MSKVSTPTASKLAQPTIYGR